MIRAPLIATILGFLAANAFGQTFHLAQPDTAGLRKMAAKSLESIGYLYLKTTYKAVTGKTDLVSYEWEHNTPCSFNQSFSNGIEYSVSECEEAKGLIEVISFPKVDLKELHTFIETLFYCSENTWTSEFKYQPEGAGCYYEIKQTETRTIIEIYCGC